MSPGRSERDAAGRCNREQAVAALDLTREHVREVGPLSRPDLDLGRDQLAGSRVREQLVVARLLDQVLECIDERECAWIEQRELLLEPHREVGRGLEDLEGMVEVYGHRPQLAAAAR